MTGFSLRRAAASDEAFLRRCHDDARTERFGALALPGEQLEVLLAGQWHAQRQSYTAQWPDASHDIIEIDGEPVGQLRVDRPGGAIHLVDISVLAPHRGLGIGTAVVQALQREAVDTNRTVTLSVATDNIGAGRLYERIGFVSVNDNGVDVAMRWGD